MGLEVRFCTRRDGVRLAYAVLGSGEPLVWLPGWINHLELMWQRRTIRTFYQRLAQTHQVVLYDKHGIGLSDRDRRAYTLETELADLTTLLDELDLPPAILVGNSQAGAVAAAFAARHPERVRALVLHGAWAHIGDTYSDDVKATIQSLVKAHWGLASELIGDLLDPGADAEGRAWLARFQRESADATTALRLLQLSYDLDVRTELPHVRAPTLVLNRTRDRIAHPDLGRQLASAIPDARLVLLPGRSHFPWEEDQSAILAAIERFLGVATPAGAGLDDAPPNDVATLRRNGDVWIVGYAGQQVLLRDVKGLHYLAELLRRPDTEVHAVDLVAAVEGSVAAPTATTGSLPVRRGPDGELGPIVDEEARERYAARVKDLRDILWHAELENDVDRAAITRSELEALSEQLAARVGLGGRDRVRGRTAERARVNATRLIRDAVRRIEEVLPDLGGHLRVSVATGTYCSYQPPPDGGPRWEL